MYFGENVYIDNINMVYDNRINLSQEIDVNKAND